MEPLSHTHYLSRLSFLTFVSLFLLGSLSPPPFLVVCFFSSLLSTLDLFPLPGSGLGGGDSVYHKLFKEPFKTNSTTEWQKVFLKFFFLLLFFLSFRTRLFFSCLLGFFFCPFALWLPHHLGSFSFLFSFLESFSVVVILFLLVSFLARCVNTRWPTPLSQLP